MTATTIGDEWVDEIANAPPTAAAVEVSIMADETSINNTADEQSRSKEGEIDESEQNRHDTEQSLTNLNITEILAKLEGLNSKDRRKLLRQLKTSSGGTIDESVIAAAEEKAHNVAERNEREAANNNNNNSNKTIAVKKSMGKPPKKRKSGDAKASAIPIVDSSKVTKKRRKKGPPVNLNDLSPEERKRRDEQRISQQQAAERRVAGLIDPDRHPLNSEQRRANRRKPGRAALIAQAKKEQQAEKGKFNAFGYKKRKGAVGGSS